MISSFDELWGYTSERSRRLWDEMVPSPVRRISCRLVTTYSGFEGESALLEELYKRGLSQQEVGTDLRAGDGLLMFWSHTPIAPWQNESWLAQMVDASIKCDSTAIVAITWDQKAQKVHLATHRVFQPTEAEPLDFEAAVEGTLLDLHKRFWLRKVLFDPWQMQATAQRLTRAGLQLEEFPQSSGNLTTASQNLFELIEGQNLVAYPDPAIRLAISRAIALETPRWRIAKEKQAHKIDVVVAVAMAAYAAVKGQSENTYITDYSRWI